MRSRSSWSGLRPLLTPSLLLGLLAAGGCATAPSWTDAYQTNPPLLLQKPATSSCVVSIVTDLTDIPAYQGPEPPKGTAFSATKGANAWLTDERMQDLMVEDLRTSGLFTQVNAENSGVANNDVYIKTTLKRAQFIYLGETTAFDLQVDIQAMKSGAPLLIKSYVKHWELPSAGVKPGVASSMQEWMRDVRHDLQDLLFPKI